MATDVRQIPYQLTDDAAFRVWVSGIDAALVACGLVNTADTGQLDPATALKPVAAGVAGYRIYRFADSLQATMPIFIKVSFGALGSGVTTPRLVVQIGTATNGAGVLTGVTTGSRTLDGSTAPVAGETRNAYTSGAQAGNARICHTNGVDAAFGSTAYNRVIGFTVERQKDATGNDLPDGVHFSWWSTTFSGHQSFNATGLTAAIESTLPILAPSQTMGSGADVGMSPMYPIFGKLLPPVLSLLGYWQNDLQTLVPVPVSLYGVARNYLPLGPNSYGSWHRGGTSSAGAQSTAMLWV